jgi:hypothetical protein
MHDAAIRAADKEKSSDREKITLLSRLSRQAKRRFVGE